VTLHRWVAAHHIPLDWNAQPFVIRNNRMSEVNVACDMYRLSSVGSNTCGRWCSVTKLTQVLSGKDGRVIVGGFS